MIIKIAVFKTKSEMRFLSDLSNPSKRIEETSALFDSSIAVKISANTFISKNKTVSKLISPFSSERAKQQTPNSNAASIAVTWTGPNCEKAESMTKSIAAENTIQKFLSENSINPLSKSSFPKSQNKTAPTKKAERTRRFPALACSGFLHFLRFISKFNIHSPWQLAKERE